MGLKRKILKLKKKMIGRNWRLEDEKKEKTGRI